MATRADDAWAAMRALAEGEPATPALLARASGRAQATIEGRARREDWRLDPRAAGRARKRRLGLQQERLIAELEEITAGRPAGGLRIDKGQVDNLIALTRAIEKIADTLPHAEEAGEDNREDDEELADVLQRIDARIELLARHYASELVEGQSLAEAGPPRDP